MLALFPVGLLIILYLVVYTPNPVFNAWILIRLLAM